MLTLVLTAPETGPHYSLSLGLTRAWLSFSPWPVSVLHGLTLVLLAFLLWSSVCPDLVLLELTLILHCLSHSSGLHRGHGSGLTVADSGPRCGLTLPHLGLTILSQVPDSGPHWALTLVIIMA